MDRAFLGLIQDYIDETLPLADAIADGALELTGAWQRGEHPVALFQRIRANLHTLKGNSAMMGFQPIQALAHALEDVCDLARDEGGRRTAATAAFLIQGGELLGQLIRSAKGELDAAPGQLIMRQIVDYAARPAPAPPAPALTPPIATPLPSRAPAAMPGAPWTIPATPAAAAPPPAPAPSVPTPAAPLAPSLPVEAAPAPSATTPVPPLAPVATGPQPPVSESRGPRTEELAAPSADAIRVDFRRLDELLELVGEAVITQSHLAEASRGLRHAHGQSHDVEQLDHGVTLLAKTLRQLKETLLATRLLPMSTLFSRFARYVHTLGQERGQSIKFVTAGGDTPIDKTIIDRLGEPLLHIVRNSVAHGLEPAEQRIAAGKPAEATITLSARYVSERVLISIADDGRGINVAKVIERARSLGYDTENISDADAMRLIFLPGFSTAAEVLTLSGRGVGLDAVTKAVHALGGSVDVDSRLGHGTIFVLNLPLTLAVVQGLLFEVDGERFALPMGAVIESFRMTASIIHEIGRLGVMTWRGGVIHVADAGALLSTDGPKGGLADSALMSELFGGQRGYCIIVGSGQKRRGLLVDKLLGLHEIVVKVLDEVLGRPDILSGATIAGDGRVVLILDAAGIVQSHRKREATRAPAPRPGNL